MICIHFRGFHIRVSSEKNLEDGEWILSQLNADFKELIGFCDVPDLEIQILTDLETPKLRLALFTSKLLVRHTSALGPFYVGFGNLKAQLSISRKGMKRFSISGESKQYIYEVLYAFILSSIGEALETRGFHRIHGLGFSESQSALVIPLNSGRGKSSMVHWLIDNTKVKFFGDECVFTNGNEVFAFPVRRALREEDITPNTSTSFRKFDRIFFEKKFLTDWPADRIQESSDNFKIILFKNTFSFAKFAWTFFWGLGNAQMAEFFLRADNFPNLVKIAFSRLRCLKRLRAHIVVLNNWDKSPATNWSCLKVPPNIW